MELASYKGRREEWRGTRSTTATRRSSSPGVGSLKFWTYGAPLGFALHARCFGSSSKLFRVSKKVSGSSRGGAGWGWWYEAGKIQFPTHMIAGLKTSGMRQKGLQRDKGKVGRNGVLFLEAPPT
jgi:hypothetical protein